MVSSGTVSSDLSNIKSCVDNTNSTVSGLSSSWQGASFDAISKQIDSAITDLLSTISSQMSAFGSACDLCKEYEQVKADLANAQASYNAADKDHKSQYTSRISTLKTKLEELKSQIEALLASISAGAASSTSSSTSTSTSTALIGDTTSNAFGSTSSTAGLTPKYGSLTKQTFTASNGTQITHLLYVPDYGQQVSGLPVNMYMTGASMTGTGEQIMTYGGVGKLLNEKSINPSGIVVVPHVPSGKQYENKAYRDALAELPVAIAKQYNGDLNRISLSGHSYGAITAYRLVDEHPNTFSAIVPVSGSAKINNTDAFKNVKIWAFHGAQDRQGNNTDYRQAVNVINTLQSIGAQVSLHSYTEYPNCYHTHTSNTTFSSEFDDNQGEKINPLEWAFKQSKA